MPGLPRSSLKSLVIKSASLALAFSWSYFKTTYYRDSGFNFVTNMSSLLALFEHLNGSHLEAFIDKYEQLYDRLRSLVSASKFVEYNSHFRQFLDHSTVQLIMAVYVDDISVYGPRSPALDEILSSLKSEFKLSDIGDIHWLLCIQITRNRDRD